MVRLIQRPKNSEEILFSFDIEGSHLYIPIPQTSIPQTTACESSIPSLAAESTYDYCLPNWMPAKSIINGTFEYICTADKLRVTPTVFNARIYRVDDYRPDPRENLLTIKETRRVFFGMKVQFKEVLINSNCDKQYFVFPDKENDICNLHTDSLIWLHTRAGYTAVGPADISFATPISKNHLLIIDLNTGNFNYGTEEENTAMRAEAEADLFEFIKSIRIDFSPEIQAQIDEARATESA